jgi:hypothetical protein
MAPLTDGIPCPRRYFNAAGLLGALDHFIRFRDVDTASLAHYNLSSDFVSRVIFGGSQWY